MCGAAPGGLPRTRRAVIVRSRIQLAAVLVVVSLASSVQATTWRVELDGTGDYTDIQPAVDAAAPGDTIRIGPGRFATFHPIIAPGWTESTIVGVLKDNLTFIGSGQDATILGPQSYWAPLDQYPKAFCSFGGYSGRLVDMTIENVRTGVYWEAGVLDIHGCTLRASDSTFIAVDLMVDDGRVQGCVFDMPAGGRAIQILNVLGNVRGMVISDCTITGARYGVSVGYGAQNVNIVDCVLDVTWWGIVFDGSSTGTVRSSRIRGAQDRSVLAMNASAIEIVDTTTEGGRIGVDAIGAATIVGAGAVIEGTTEATLSIAGNSRVSFSGSHILPVSGWAVFCYTFSGSNVTIDLTGNYWGITDPVAIEASIHDSRYYSPNPYTVLYAPFANGPTPTVTTSWGHLKALWR
jgi:hypothetical protein